MKSKKTVLKKFGLLFLSAASVAAVLISCSAVQIDPAAGVSSSTAVSEPYGTQGTAAAVSGPALPASSGTGDTGINGVRYYFPRAGQKAQPVLIGVIGSARHTLDVAIYSFTDKEIAAALIKAKTRGVSVRLITDKTQAATRSQQTVIKQIVKAGIPVKVDTHKGIMHLKITVADGKTATTGSFNYTQAAEKSNDEVLVVIDNEKIAQDFDREFGNMWNDPGNFKKYS